MNYHQYLSAYWRERLPADAKKLDEIRVENQLIVNFSSGTRAIIYPDFLQKVWLCEVTDEENDKKTLTRQDTTGYDNILSLVNWQSLEMNIVSRGRTQYRIDDAYRALKTQYVLHCDPRGIDIWDYLVSMMALVDRMASITEQRAKIPADMWKVCQYFNTPAKTGAETPQDFINEISDPRKSRVRRYIFYIGREKQVMSQWAEPKNIEYVKKVMRNLSLQVRLFCVAQMRASTFKYNQCLTFFNTAPKTGIYRYCKRLPIEMCFNLDEGSIVPPLPPDFPKILTEINEFKYVFGLIEQRSKTQIEKQIKSTFKPSLLRLCKAVALYDSVDNIDEYAQRDWAKGGKRDGIQTDQFAVLFWRKLRTQGKIDRMLARILLTFLYEVRNIRMVQDPDYGAKTKPPPRPSSPTQSEEKSVTSDVNAPHGRPPAIPATPPASPPRSTGFRQLPGLKPEERKPPGRSRPVEMKDMINELEERRRRIRDKDSDTTSSNSMVPLLILGAIFFIMVK